MIAEARRAPTAPSGAVPVAALALAAAWAFAPGLAALAEAWSMPEYSHGPLIPLISLWLFLRERRDAPPDADTGGARWPGAALLAGALGVAALGRLAAVPDVVAYAILPWCAGMVALAGGLRALRRHWASVLHLAFMLPLPHVLYWQASLALQGVSAEIGVALLRLADIPVFLDGHVIDLGPWRLAVAEACSGLRYLFPILSFTWLVAVLYRGPRWHKVLLVLSCAPIAIALNAARIGLIGIMVDARGIEAAQGAMHWLEGWVVFGLSLALVLVLAVALRRLAGGAAGPLLNLDGAGVWPHLRAAPAACARPGALAGTAATAAVALALAAMPPLARHVPDRVPLAAFPMQMDGWRGIYRPLAPEVEEALDATDYLDAAFVSTAGAAGGAAPVSLFVAWYADQASGSGIHSPEACLPAGGWEVEAFERVRIAPAGAGFPANRAVISKGAETRLVLWWFDQRGTRRADDRLAKLAALRDAVVTGRADGALVRAMTPIRPGETAAAAEARLTALLRPALEALPRHVPGRASGA